ncbi:glycoside hydrolase family 32 protein [Micromonospora soli]|uniref:glycoside hydrolase family 32 protein n=1 Tax=Micromonospora sp. NBRC 110009 TaxID=3061627 RepID=UPI002673813A|nr:glycoside hydrolase family 32 protein [Micromonospora sp. NBRC 110009]WKT97381.1 glycoside hydrolase family 32 protein [Micromonospora sp. NBRC 110009]
MKVRYAAMAAATVLAAAVGLAGVTVHPVSAGTQQDYPEFPYPVTNYQEDNRGQYHFSARGGWINDVNAPLYYHGVYHLYYQHNPHGLQWDTMHWGHATSTDLVHWKQKPIALEPGVHPGNLWSGGGVVDTKNVSGLKNGDEDPIVVYSGTNGVTVFYSTDGGYTFKTYDGGRPVAVPQGTSRDPKVFWDEASGRWGMVVWSDHGGNGVDFYTSDNLLSWTFASRYRADWLFECPNMVPMPLDGDPANLRWVLSDAGGEYVVGTFDGTTFTTDRAQPRQLNHGDTSAGGSYYAGLNFANMPDDRIVSMAWQPGNSGSIWTGNLTFPVEMRLATVDGAPQVLSTPIDEIDGLRTATRTWTGRTLNGTQARALLAGVRADTYELEASFRVPDREVSRFGFRLGTGRDGWYDHEVSYDPATGTLNGVPMPPVNGVVTLRLLVDRGQLEIFGNDGRFYQSLNVNFDSLPGDDTLELFADGKVHLDRLTFHELGSIWGGESTLVDNLGGQWYADSGLWSDTSGGKKGTSGGDAFYLNTRTGDDFTYEADVRLDSGIAAALTFRANRDATRHYTANVDSAAKVVKLWRPGRDIATYPLDVKLGRTYHLKVVADGSRLRVYLDGGTTPVIDAVDDTIPGGQFGMNVFNGTGVIQNVRVGPVD